MILLWLVGIANGVAYGSTGPHGVAVTWSADEPPGFVCTPFEGAEWVNGTVCTALSGNHEYAAVEWAYRNGELWWCEDGECEWVAGGGYVAGIGDDGDMWGSSGAANCHGVLWLEDATRRFDYPDWYRILNRAHEFVTVSNLDAHRSEETYWRFDWNADGRIGNGDIDEFVRSLLSGEPTANTQVAENGDIDGFVAALLH